MLIPAADRFPNGFTFIQDNSSIHTAKVVKEWFSAHPFIEKLDFSAKAPDMNPIENVWGLMVKRLNSENLSKRDLWFKVIDCWEELAKDLMLWVDLAYSMPDRLRHCIEKNGKWSKY